MGVPEQNDVRTPAGDLGSQAVHDAPCVNLQAGGVTVRQQQPPPAGAAQAGGEGGGRGWASWRAGGGCGEGRPGGEPHLRVLPAADATLAFGSAWAPNTMARSVLESAPSTPSEDHSQSSTLAVDPGWILPPMTCALQASTRGRAG